MTRTFLSLLTFTLLGWLVACGDAVPDESGPGTAPPATSPASTDDAEAPEHPVADPAPAPDARGSMAEGAVPGAGPGEAADADRGSDPGSDPEEDPAEDLEGDAEADAESGIRLVRAPDDEWRGVLQTSIVPYRHPDGHRLDVVNVMHLGDRAYYDELDRRFEAYDAVLYEMIKPEAADPDMRGGDGGMLGMLQKAMGRALGATFQLDEIDYGRPNFVHADLTAEKFAKLWKEREESIFKLMLRAMSAGSGGNFDGEVTPATLFRIAKTRDTPRLRMLLAEMFAQPGMLAGLTDVGPDGRDRSMLIGERNKAALEISMRELAGDADHVALFYGAGHWPDLDVRLREDLGFERGEPEWIAAWQIEPKPAADQDEGR